MALGLLDQFPQWRVNCVDRSVNFRAPRLVEKAFHQSLQAQMARERQVLVLQARASQLSEKGLQRLVDYAERLLDEEA
jgi:hypothetical protein